MGRYRMKIYEGFKNISVKLLNFPVDLPEKAYDFGRFSTESVKFRTDRNGKSIGFEAEFEKFVNELVNGKTFPKYVMEAKIDFEIQGITRICLAQLTRDSAIFGSESHGLRPLSMEFNLPLSLTTNKAIMSRFIKAQQLLEEAYIIACENEVPYPESRYLGLHAQTISVTASYKISDFVRSCYSRTNNSFCDELNYVYRKMYHAIVKRVAEVASPDANHIKFWNWLFSVKRCIDDNYYTRTNVYNGDFQFEDAQYVPVDKPAQNDWRKSGWALELIQILHEEPELLTNKERTLVKEMERRGLDKLYTTYDEREPRVAPNAIKDMDYYRKVTK